MTIDNLSNQGIRSSYLKQNDWVSPEDMVIIEKGLTPNTHGTEAERKEAFIEKLKTENIPDSIIQKYIAEIELIHGAGTGQWNYEYIRARFEVYKRQMSHDAEWNRIDSLYQNDLKSDSALLKK